MASHARESTRHSTVSYTCECGSTVSGTIYHAVNVTLEPQLLYALLAGRLNTSTCPNCGRSRVHEIPFIYHDLKRGLFAYVHPDAEPEDEEREQLLQRLRQTYTEAAERAQRIEPEHRPAQRRPPEDQRARGAADLPRAVTDPAAPPMQVIFGMDQLVALVTSLLESDEQLSQIRLHTTSQDPAVRQRFLDVARRMASEVGCTTEVTDRGGTCEVEIYGPRGRIRQLASMLRAQA